MTDATRPDPSRTAATRRVGVGRGRLLAAPARRAIARPRLIAAFCLCAAGVSPSASAQVIEATSPIPTTAAKQKAPKAAKHPSLSIGDHVTLEFTARLESDVRFATPAIGLDHAEREWQDRRVGVEGTVFRRIKFEVSRELGKDFEAAAGLSIKTPWRDAYADVRIAKALIVKAGRFKIPFGYEALTGESNLDFAYRSLAGRVLSPGRDAGVMAHGRMAGRLLAYEVGYFTRDGDHMRTSQTEGGQDAIAARMVVTPLVGSAHLALAPLQLALATMRSHLDDRLGVRGRTVFGDGVFFDRVYVNGRRQRLGLEAAWEGGPIGLSSEYIVVSDGRRAMGFAGEDLADIQTRSWYVAGTWTLTGERKRGRIEPRRDFVHGGLGAFEPALRVEGLRFDDATAATAAPLDSFAVSGNTDRVTTVGLNWYLNHYVKIQWNFVRERIDDAGRSPAPVSGGRFNSHVLRLQFRI
jgi:phosphate-selective porin OprO/OprP